MHISTRSLIIRIALFVLIALAVAFGVFFFAVVPSMRDFFSATPGKTSILYDRTGQHVLYQLHGEENRKVLPHDEIPNTVRLATIAVEDEHFYQHPGIDVEAIIRAARVNFAAGDFEQGASTITQQLARATLLSRDKTLERKIVEAFLALKIDFALSKDEILDRYLNTIPYGSNAYGIQAAAETFFNKNAKDLSLSEAALLAALPNAPSYYSPYGNNGDDLKARQEMILRKLRANGWITTVQMNDALKDDTLARVVPLTRPIAAPHFVFHVLEELERTYGKERLETSGLHIYTTLDWEAQQKAEAAVRAGAERNASWNASNAAMVVLDAERGEILAMVGSKDYFNKSIDGQVNVATAPRQPGSSFKPLVYARAFEKGYQPETILFDLPMNFGPDGTGKNYRPQNYDNSYHGTVSMRQALANSLNIPAVQTQYLAGIDSTLDQIAKMGITSATDRNRYGLSLVLGGAEVSLLEMTGAYSVFSQEGIYRAPTGVLRIESSEKEVLYEKQPRDGERAISAETARKISSILSDNRARSMVFGSNSPLAFPEGGVAAKTGTTQNFRDAWTMGFTRRVALGVWVGNNDNTEMRAGADGVFVAAPIWREMMDYMVTRFPPEQFTEYQPVKSNKPLLTGSFSGAGSFVAPEIKEEGGEKDRPEGEEGAPRPTQRLHSILYYVNRDDPLSEKRPDYSDPMLWRFEEPLRPAPEDEDKDKEEDKDKDDD